MLADEPLASLDPASAERVMGYLKRASQVYNVATPASLHQVNIVRYFGERFIGLKDGEVVFDGEKDELTAEVIDDIYGDVVTVGLGVESGGSLTDAADLETVVNEGEMAVTGGAR